MSKMNKQLRIAQVARSCFVSRSHPFVVVITCMLWSAIISGNKYAVGGAILFVISDSLLAWNMFVIPMPWLGSYGVMITYDLAQFLIAKSIGWSRQNLRTDRSL